MLKKNTKIGTIRQKSPEWKKKIQQHYPQAVFKDILEVFTLFILDRFRSINYEEGFEMFNINLANTRAGQGMIEMGKLILAREDIIDNIQNRFGKYPQDLLDSLEGITDLTQLKKLRSLTLECDTIDGFRGKLKKD